MFVLKVQDLAVIFTLFFVSNMINKVYNDKEIICYYDGKGSHSFRDYKTDDSKSLPLITRRWLQESILL